MSDGENLVFVQSELAQNGFPIMEEIRRMGKLCDVTLKVEDQCFSAHRIVLAATIPYFRAMFTHDMVEAKEKEISIQGIEPGALECLINYAYSGRIVINAANVQGLLVGASFLQLHDVRSACCDFLKKRLQPSNVLGIRSFADALSCSSLVDAANRYLHRHFVSASKSEEFVNLSISDIAEIIQKDELELQTEEQVFEAILTWMNHDLEMRGSCLSELLAAVRMTFLSPPYIADNISPHQLVKGNLLCRDLVDEAKDYHLLPDRRYKPLKYLNNKPRCGPDPSGLIYAIGGLTKSGDSVSTVEVYDPATERWKMAEAMTMHRSRVGVAVMNSQLYAIGGYNGVERLSTVEVFNPELKTWSKVASMNTKRSAVGATHLNNELYICGGYDGMSSLNTVECYHPTSNEWTMVASMTKFRSAAGVVSFKGQIYALGGHDGLTIFDSVERFDPVDGTWHGMEKMQTKRCRLGVATLKGKIYACGGYDGSTFLKSVEVYDPVTNAWTYVMDMNMTRSRVALVANQDKLWAIGGYDGITNLNTVEVYDPEKDKWKFVAPMYAHEGGVGVGVIPTI